MAENIKRHIAHIKSRVVEENKPKLPTAAQIELGEIAINYATGYETISLKNESGNVVTFSEDNYYTEKKLGSGFTGVNSGKTVTEAIVDSEEVSVSSGVTPTGTGVEIWIDESADSIAVDVYTKAETDSLLDLKSDTGHTHDASGVTAMTDYAMAASGVPISTSDSLNAAIGKLEKMINELKDYIEQKEFAIAAAITDLDNRLKALE